MHYGLLAKEENSNKSCEQMILIFRGKDIEGKPRFIY
jgi:hypothetical protein